MTQFYIVTVGIPGKEITETHQADSWQSAVLSHSYIGAEFEDLVDEFDLENRCEKFGYVIHWEFAK